MSGLRRPIAGHEQAVASPGLTVTVEYDGGAKDVITLGGAAENGLRYVLHGTTGQLFVISADDAGKMTPDAKALLELPPPPKEAPPAVAAGVPAGGGRAGAAAGEVRAETAVTCRSCSPDISPP